MPSCACALLVFAQRRRVRCWVRERVFVESMQLSTTNANRIVACQSPTWLQRSGERVAETLRPAKFPCNVASLPLANGTNPPL
jgi:hypothetical protein